MLNLKTKKSKKINEGKWKSLRTKQPLAFGYTYSIYSIKK